MPPPVSQNRFVLDARETAHNVDLLALLFKRYLNNTQVRAISEVVFDGYRIDNSRRSEANASAMMQGLRKTGRIYYLISQGGRTLAEEWDAPTIAHNLADTPGLEKSFDDAFDHALRKQIYAIDLQQLIDVWLKQQEVKQSGLLPPSQQATDSAQPRFTEI